MFLCQKAIFDTESGYSDDLETSAMNTFQLFDCTSFLRDYCE